MSEGPGSTKAARWQAGFRSAEGKTRRGEVRGLGFRVRGSRFGIQGAGLPASLCELRRASRFP